MSRVILVSNRVMDLRKAAQAGGVAVALAHVARTRPSLWFGWSGDVKQDAEGRARGARGLLPGLRQLGPVARLP
jgi:trehalose 6-phosphate synthase